MECHDIRALTLHRPWSDAIATGQKRIENRPWKPWPKIIGRDIAIHAGKQYDHKGARYMLRSGIFHPPVDVLSPTGVVAIVTVAGFVSEIDHENPWFFGPYGWILKNVRRLTKPIHCSGRQGLWRVPNDVVRELQKLEVGHGLEVRDF